MFSVRAFIVLLLYAITLRDILIDRMKGFSSSVILSILSDTLVHYLLQWGFEEGLWRSHLIARTCSNRRETSSGVSTV